MNAPSNLSINDRIRARDGDCCWLCGGKLDFKAEPNSKKAPTREHLVAQSLGGTNDLANLVLCHPGCNKQLGARPVAEKQKMRQKNLANRTKVAAADSAKAVRRPATKGIKPPAPLQDLPPSLTSTSTRSHRVDEAVLLKWQIAALVAGGLALLSTGISLGLLLG